MRLHTFVFISLLLLPHSLRAQDASSTSSPGCPTPMWRLAYQHDAEGRPAEGRKSDLFDAIRRGYPIRLAWGSSARVGERTVTVEHSADPVFVTIMNGAEVVAQLPEHIAQTSYWDPAQAGFDKGHVLWRGMMATSGRFDAIFVDRATGAEVRRLPQRARIAWSYFGPAPACAPPAPVLAVPGGVTRRHEPGAQPR